MSRLTAFWAELWSSMPWIDALAERADKMKKICELVALLLPILGIATCFGDWASAVNPWAAIALVGVGVLYLVWRSAIAWDRTRGPIIWIGEFEFDRYYKMFDIRIKNAGLDEVYAKIYVVDLRDSSGKRIPRIDHQWPAHWRGMEGDKCLLFGDRHGTAGVLIAAPDPRHSMCPCLQVAMPGIGRPNAVLLYPIEATPIDQQERVTLTIRVDFCDADDKFIKSKLKTVTVIPPDAKSNPLDPESLTRYTIKRR